jgi:ribosome-associated protein
LANGTKSKSSASASSAASPRRRSAPRASTAPRARPRSSRQKALFAASALAARKAQRPVILDLRKLTLIADYFVICHGASDVHVRALARELEEQLEAHRMKRISVQGMSEGRWVLVDLGDVIVHVLGEFERGFYDLERLWGDAPVIEIA